MPPPAPPGPGRSRRNATPRSMAPLTAEFSVACATGLAAAGLAPSNAAGLMGPAARGATPPLPAARTIGLGVMGGLPGAGDVFGVSVGGASAMVGEEGPGAGAAAGPFM